MVDHPSNPEFSKRIAAASVYARDRTVKRTSAEIVATELSWQIMVQQYPPGSRLREQELSSEFNVSRTVIRDVIGKLAARGFLEIHPWRGASVVSYTVDELSDLLELNATVFGMVARYAASRRDQTHLARMDGIFARMSELDATQVSPEEFHVSRVEFYTALNDASGSFCSGRRRANFPLTFYHQHVLADAMTPDLRQRQVTFFGEVLQHLHEGAVDAAQKCVHDNFMLKRSVVLQSLHNTRSEAKGEGESEAVA